MNNPFLSDRNIFSKVVNPIKKKPEADKQKREGPPFQSFNRGEYNTVNNNQGTIKNSEVPSTNNYQSLKEGLNLASNLNSKQPIGKMSFGKPPELQADNRLSFNNNYGLSNKTVINDYNPKLTTVEFQKQSNFNLNANQSRPFLKNDYKSISIDENFDLTSPNQQIKFEQYRKANKYNQYSPIQPQVNQKLQDSQFLNIDAIGDDLNKFLASSKNQEEICKLLGINVQSKKKPQVQTEKIEKKSEIKAVTRVAAPKEQTNPNMFSKQKKHQSQVYRQSLIKQNSKEDKEYIPTFNYMCLQEQKETFSRDQEDIPRFAAQNNKRNCNEKERQSIEVFNYSQTNAQKAQTSLQDLLNQEMNALAWNGKYRTFLTSSQKIVTFRYKMQPL